MMHIIRSIVLSPVRSHVARDENKLVRVCFFVYDYIFVLVAILWLRHLPFISLELCAFLET